MEKELSSFQMGLIIAENSAKTRPKINTESTIPRHFTMLAASSKMPLMAKAKKKMKDIDLKVNSAAAQEAKAL